ncbi:hypothetical protein SLS58_003123 [Diplodia intermedia]|uniref:BTB domain-containing protein n=1 Tax=Diplodia intermedia TaxID=856260 RepID=A0ABR3TWY1_9PEZI
MHGDVGPRCAVNSATLVFHATICSLGEIYAISGLEQLAKRRFEKATKQPLVGHVIEPAIQAIYESTLEDDRGLRDVAVDQCIPHIKALLEDHVFKQMMNNVGALGTDLLLGLCVYNTLEGVILKEAFHSGKGEYSDMTIRDSDGRAYQVHKNVVCWQSPFFANAMKDGRFKESFDKRVDLFEDKPAAIRAMLEYMYGGEYDEGDRDSEVEMRESLQLHVDVYVIADKYHVNQNGLATLACKRIDDFFKAYWMVMMEDFPALMDEIYTKTRDNDRILRPLVVDIAARHYAYLKDRSDFSAAANEWPNFGLILAEQMHKVHGEEMRELREEASKTSPDCQNKCNISGHRVYNEENLHRRARRTRYVSAMLEYLYFQTPKHSRLGNMSPEEKPFFYIDLNSLAIEYKIGKGDNSLSKLAMDRIALLLANILQVNFFATGRYSDMQIKDSNGHVYNVHKIVVCSQSDFFANAFKENTFKESKDNLIHLPADDPAAVRAMLQFMYTGTYDNPVFFGSVDAMLLLHLHVYLLADKYAVGSALAPAPNNNAAHHHPVTSAIYANVARKNTLAGMAATRLRDDLLALWPLVQPVFPQIVKAVYDATAGAGSGSHDMIRGDVAMVAAKHVGAFVGDDEDEDGKSEGGGIEAALRAGFVGGRVEEEDGEQGEGEGEGEGEADVLGPFGRDLVRILARERDELKAKLARFVGAAAAAGGAGGGGSEDGGDGDSETD